MSKVKAAVEIDTVQSMDHPAWQLLFEQKDDLTQSVAFFKPEQLHDFHFRTLLVARLDRCIAGILSLHNVSKYHENGLGVGYVSTHKKFQDLGVATAMVSALFVHAQIQGKAIVNSRYEPDGEIYLQHVMQRTSNKYPYVEFVERDYSG